MIERIRELEDQCWVQIPGPSTINTVFDRKKFAELIVNECVRQCESIGEIAEQTNTGEMARKTKATANGCAQMIKWRFGIA